MTVICLSCDVVVSGVLPLEGAVSRFVVATFLSFAQSPQRRRCGRFLTFVATVHRRLVFLEEAKEEEEVEEVVKR